MAWIACRIAFVDIGFTVITIPARTAVACIAGVRSEDIVASPVAGTGLAFAAVNIGAALCKIEHRGIAAIILRSPGDNGAVGF